MGTIWSNPDGLRVQFGTRNVGDEANFAESGAVGSYKETVVHIKGTDFITATGVYTGTTVVLPAGYTNRESLTQVLTAFVVGGGGSNVINVGVSGTESTNRLVQITSAQANAAGDYNTSASAAGTLAVGTPLAAQSTVTIALGGTTPTITTAGKLVVRVRYQDVALA